MSLFAFLAAALWFTIIHGPLYRPNPALANAVIDAFFPTCAVILPIWIVHLIHDPTLKDEERHHLLIAIATTRWNMSLRVLPSVLVVVWCVAVAVTLIMLSPRRGPFADLVAGGSSLGPSLPWCCLSRWGL
jgi:hypothetical protein